MARFKLRILLLTILVALICLAPIYRFGPHFRWYFSRERAKFGNIQAVPVRMMPNVTVPIDWVRTDVGSLTLALPVKLTNGEQSQSEAQNIVIFADDTLEVGVSLPNDYRLVQKAWDQMLGNMPRRGNEKSSVARLTAEIYEAAADDFHWWMTPDELQWHRWQMENSSLVRNAGAHAIEMAFLPSIEGLLQIRSESSAWFEWYATDGSRQGTILFKSKDGRELDMNSVAPYVKV